MAGHQPATADEIERAAMEYVANTDFARESPNIRRFVRYVKVVQAPDFEPRATPASFNAALEAWAKEPDDA